MLSAVQSYTDLQAEYDRALNDYQRHEAEYLRALEANRDDPRLPELYERLESMRRGLSSLYSQVREMRNSLAHERDQALSRATSSA